MNNTLENLTWDDLRIFAEAVKQGSFSRTAQALGVSQPTVSRRIEELEHSLGRPLLIRSASGCTPTELGRTVLPLVEQMKTAASGLARVAASSQDDLKGVVRIASGELIGRHLVRNSWQITSGAPNLDIEVVTGLGYVNLNAGEADISLRNKPPEGEQIYARKLWDSYYAVYSSPGYRDANPAASDERRYEQCRWIGYVAKTTAPTVRWMRAHLPESEPSLRFSTPSLIMEAAIAGLGLCVLPIFIAEQDPRLVRLSEPWKDFHMELWMVTHANSRRIPEVRWTMNRLTEIFKQDSK